MGNSDTLRRSPMYYQLETLGRVDYQVAGWHSNLYYESNESLLDEYDIPDHVGGPEILGAEHLAVRDTGGLCDLTALGPIEISGDGAESFVQNIFTNDMDIDVNRSRYTVMVNDEGGIIGDIVVTRLDEDTYWAIVLGGPIIQEHTDWMKQHAGDDVDIRNLDDAYAGIGVWGPNARDAVSPLTDADLSNDAFGFFDGYQLEIAGAPVTAIRVSFVGEYGWELWTPMGYASELWENLWETAQDADMVPLGFGPLGAMSAEKGFRLLGADIGKDHNPFEASLGYTVDMDTDFVGKEALEQIQEDGVDERLIPLTMDDPSMHPEEGAPIVADDTEIGEATRTAYGFSIDESIVYAYLPPEYDEPGRTLGVEVDGEEQPATVREEPLFDPERTRLEG